MIYYNIADQGFKSSSRASVGVYNVSMQLGAHLSDELPCTFLLNEQIDLGDIAPSVGTQIVKGRANGFRRVAWDQWGLFSSIDAGPSDWLFLPKGYSSFMRKPPCKLAVYIHDVVYSYWRMAYSGYRSPWLHKYFDLGLKASFRNADLVLTNSDFTASELHRFALKSGMKKLPDISVAGIGFDHLLHTPCNPKREGILVYVSAWPHKSTATLLPMLERWQSKAGFTEPVYLLGTPPVDLKIKSFPNWKMMSTLPEKDYRALLGRVRCSVFNSEYEGFGMPPGEALIQGAVPVYSSIPALDEVMNGIGLPYDNTDYGTFARALDEGLLIAQEQISDWKREFLEQHNWLSVTRRIKRALA